MDKLYKVGFRSISLGIESPNEETLKLMNKYKGLSFDFFRVRMPKDDKAGSKAALVDSNDI